jgi:DNA invertase Pin-like site-specific DNA recombinase
MNNPNTASKPTITVIPASIDRHSLSPFTHAAKKRVAAYARVSTDLEEQLSSYEAQVDFYTKHIKANNDWIFVKVYTDEGISATSTKNRDGFNQMVEDALAGKIDLILTKSVSRFARNTVDTLTTVRKLKEKGIEVYFEKENIYTLDSKGELLITIMSSLAQEESRSISENVTWGQRKRMQDGKVTMPYKRFLGYTKGADGTPAIVESEAAVIRQIYALFLEGRTYREIAVLLTEQGISTPGGKTIWAVSTVRSILQNEKYKGDALLQKGYTVDFLTKKRKVNAGEIPQFYVENSHPAIVSQSTYELVQDEIRRRGAYGKQISGSGLFTGKVVCGDCGGLYGPKVWHAKDKYRRTIWQCNRKYGSRAHCPTPHLTENILKSIFAKAWNHILADKDNYIAEYEALLTEMTDIAAFDKQTAVLMAECSEASALAQETLAQNAARAQNQSEYQKRYDALITRYDAAKAKLGALAKDKQEYIARKEKIRHFLKILRCEKQLFIEFDERLWRETVVSVTIRSLEDITVLFKSGTEIHVSAKESDVQ